MNYSDFESFLAEHLAEAGRRSLYRQLGRTDSAQGPVIMHRGVACLNFSSNDYLGLAHEPGLGEAAAAAIAQYGTGSGASRLLGGSLAPHEDLEDVLADFKGTAAARVFSSGFLAALGVVPALVGAGDTILLDRRAHACFVDAARLSGARLRVFRHNDLNQLESWLQAFARSRPERAPTRHRVLIITESVFSMDGDLAPLRDIVELKERFGAWLLVDEAHATGLFGPTGAGLIDEYHLTDRVEAQLGTLGKALGAAGGFVCGSRALGEWIVNRARSFIFSTAPPPAASAAATAAIRFVRSAEGQERRHRLWAVVDCAKNRLINSGIALRPVAAPIIPLILGDEGAAVQAAAELWDRGIFLPAVRFPAVARGAARLRLSLSAHHDPEAIERLCAGLRDSGLIAKLAVQSEPCAS